MGASRATGDRTMSIRHVLSTHGPDAARRVAHEAQRQHVDLGITSSTHVIVGDHEPERRINHDPCDGDPGTTVDQCKGVACKRHNRCCWQ